MHRFLVSLAVACFVATACGGGAPGPQPYSKDLGLASPSDLSEAVQDVLFRFQYELDRVETESASNTVYQTYWRTRFPFSDEHEDAIEARTRITVRARARRRASSGSTLLLTATFLADNQTQHGDTLGWRPAPITREVKGYLDEISIMLRERLEEGLRRF